MADTKISVLPAATTPLAGTEDIPLVQGGETRQANLADVRDAALRAEVEAARGDRSALALRLATISNFASPNAGGIVVGNYYDNSFQGTNSATQAGGAALVYLAPFYTSQRMRIDRLGVDVSTLGSAGGKCCIYDAGSDGWPSSLLLEPADALSFTTTGLKQHTVDFTFDSGRQYWVGVRFEGSGTIRALNASSAVNLGLQAGAGSNYFKTIRRSVSFITPLPSSWGFLSSDLSTDLPPSIRMRAAALP